MSSGYYLDKHRRVREVESGRLAPAEAFKLIAKRAREAMGQVSNVLDDDVNLLWAHESLREILAIANEQEPEAADE